MPAPKPQTMSAIASEIGQDVARVRKVAKRLGITPTGKNAHNADLYRLSKADKAKLKSSCITATAGGGSSQPELPLDLKEQKLQEEVEHLRLKNSKLRDESTSNRVVAQIIGGLCSFLGTYLTQKLEIENPVQTAGLEPAEIRGINKKMNDEIRARYAAELEKWKQYVDEQKDQNQE